MDYQSSHNRHHLFHNQEDYEIVAAALTHRPCLVLIGGINGILRSTEASRLLYHPMPTVYDPLRFSPAILPSFASSNRADAGYGTTAATVQRAPTSYGTMNVHARTYGSNLEAGHTEHRIISNVDAVFKFLFSFLCWSSLFYGVFLLLQSLKYLMTGSGF